MKKAARLDDMPDILTADDAASVLRVGRNQIYESLHRGDIWHIRVGRSIRIPKGALLRLLEARVPDVMLAHDLPRATKGKDLNGGRGRRRAQP